MTEIINCCIKLDQLKWSGGEDMERPAWRDLPWGVVQQLVDDVCALPVPKLSPALPVVLRLLSNVVAHPHEEKYARARRSGVTYGAVREAGEAVERCLTLGGWEIEGDELLCRDKGKAGHMLQLMREVLFPEVAFDVEMRDAQHNVVHVLSYPLQRWPCNLLVHVMVDDRLKEKAFELGWPGFGLWASHEPVDRSTQLCEVMYLIERPALRIVLQAENHACSYRGIPPHIANPPRITHCLSCGNSLPEKGGNTGGRMLCFHQGQCEACAKTTTRCAVCFKPKKARVGYRGM